MTGPLAGARGELGLADGSRMTLRSVEPEDTRLLAAAFDELSEQSRYRRFFTPLRAAATGLLAITHRGWSTHE